MHFAILRDDIRYQDDDETNAPAPEIVSETDRCHKSAGSSLGKGNDSCEGNSVHQTWLGHALNFRHVFAHEGTIRSSSNGSTQVKQTFNCYDWPLPHPESNGVGIRSLGERNAGQG